MYGIFLQTGMGYGVWEGMGYAVTDLVCKGFRLWPMGYRAYGLRG